MKQKHIPRELVEAPALDRSFFPSSICRHHLVLINPFYPKDPYASFGKHVLTPSLALTSIAASTPADWSIVYWDENLLQGTPPRDPFPQVVGISVHLTFAERAFEIADWYRERGAKVVLGGLHVLSCPDECAPHADVLALGEGVNVWHQILSDIDSGFSQPRYNGSFTQPHYREDPIPRREILPKEHFLTTASLIATRGCHNRCGFCYLSTDGLFQPYQMKDPQTIVEEFLATGEPYGVFIDNNLGSRPRYLYELCQALKPIKKIWSAAVSIDVTDDPSLIREMALAGCTGVFVGFESLTNENLTDSRKKTPRTEDYARRVRIFHDNGIQVNGSFVLGFDHDKPNVFGNLVDWIEENRLECATFHILTPYPATPLFEQMESEGRLLHKEWIKYDTANVVFKPKNMSAEYLAEGYAYCYERLFSHRSIWRRRPEDIRAVLPYLAMSYLYKKSNWMWHLLIKYKLTHAVWHPLVSFTRIRHLSFRKRLARKPMESHESIRGISVVSAGV
jgi:radical SAM superfamily enzyme YgiQ (UPF0313 family)